MFEKWFGSAEVEEKAKKADKEKRRAEFNVEEWREKPFMAYMERTGPKTANARKIVGKLDAIENLHCAEDIHEAMRPRYGRGEYKAKCFEQDDRSIYLGTYHFVLPGEFRVDGRIIETEDSEEKDKPKAKGRVAELRAEAEELEEQRKVEKAKAQLKREQDEHADDTQTLKELHEAQMTSLREEFQGSLQQQQEDFETRMDERDEQDAEKEEEDKRDRERREWKDELKQQREDSDKRFADLLTKLDGDKEASSQSSNLNVLMTAMKTSADAQMEAMKQMHDGIRHQSETLIGFLNQPSPAAAEAAQAREALLTAFQTQLAQLRDNKENKIEDFMRMLDVVQKLLATQGGGDNVWPGVVSSIGSSLTEAMRTLGEQRNALPPPDMDKIGEVVEDKAKKAFAKANAAVQVRKERLVRTANPEPPEARTTEPEDPNLVNQVLRIIMREMAERLDPPTWPQFIIEHDDFPDEVIQAILTIQTPEDFGNVVAALMKHGEEKVVSEFVESVRGDQSTVLWLAVGFANLRELITAS